MSYEAWGEPDEGPQCVDCGCEIDFEEDGPKRCDACKSHEEWECGKDCPVVCGMCNRHHCGPEC